MDGYPSCFTAIVIVKQLYGGLGRNFANPAIVARIFLLLSFTSRMTTWPLPNGVDGKTGPTPLGVLSETPIGQISKADLPSNMELF